MEGDDVVIGVVVAEDGDVAVPYGGAVENGAVECEVFVNDDLCAVQFQMVGVFVLLTCDDGDADALWGEVEQTCHDA